MEAPCITLYVLRFILLIVQVIQSKKALNKIGKWPLKGSRVMEMYRKPNSVQMQFLEIMFK